MTSVQAGLFAAASVGLACVGTGDAPATVAAEPSERPTEPEPRPADATPTPRPASAVISVPPATAAQPPAGPLGGEIGTQHPTALIGTAPQGHWVALCQARENTDDQPGIKVKLGRHGDTYGDALTPYLVTTGGIHEQEIAEFVGADPTGRFVALVPTTGGLVLYDSWADEERLIEGARVPSDEDPFGGHPAAAFAEGTLAFVRQASDGAQTLVVRDIIAGTETAVDPGPGTILRFEFGPDAKRIALWMALRDTNGDGKVTPPMTRTSLASRHCRGPVSSYSRSGIDGDEPVTKIATIGGDKPAQEVPGFIAMLRGGALARQADGTIVRLGDGATQTVFEAACAAEILGFVAERDEVWATCSSERSETREGYAQAPMVHFADGTVRAVGQHGENQGRDIRHPGDGLLFTIEGNNINTRTGTVAKAIGGEGSPAAIDGDRLLYASSKRSFVYDMATAKRTNVRGLDPGWLYVRRGTMLAVETGAKTTVYDFARDTVLGSTAKGAMAVSTTGDVLLANKSAGLRMALPTGPLRWHAPK